MITVTDDELTIQFENSGKILSFCNSVQSLHNENTFHLNYVLAKHLTRDRSQEA